MHDLQRDNEEKVHKFPPRFRASNTTEFDGFFQDAKMLSTNPPGGTPSSESFRFQPHKKNASEQHLISVFTSW